ncbi:MAG: helix-turn-helix domain-containing protein [Patescibacteria group bacterium]|nr:helix-turn-helix domain-containing protein [Patescibacteria group bacterium]
MKDVSPILQSLGLLDSEINTYLAALENGPGTALELAKKTRLSRQATYVAIETLSGRGLMSSVVRGKKRLYVAEPPAKLLAYAKRRDAETHERVRDLENMLPELELQAGGERPVVKVFEGKEGLFAIIEDMQRTKRKDGVELTDLTAMYQVLTTDDLARLRQELKKQGVHIRGLYSGAASSANVVDTERIFLPPEMSSFRSNIAVYGEKVALVTFVGKMYSVIIENPDLTKAMRLLFDLALKGAQPPKE